MAQEPTHPLLSLPDEEIVEKIREMSFEEVIEFSLISEKTKNLVKSAKLQGTNVIVHILSKVDVRFKFDERVCKVTFQNIESMRSMDEKKLKAPLEVKLSHQNSYIEKTIRRDEFEMDDWMEHFNTIFNFRGIDSIKFDIYSEEYDPGDIKKYFGVPTSLDVEHTGNYAYNQTVLKTFVTVESLIITPDVFENSRIPPEILIQHFKSLTIDEFGHVDPKALALNDLLIINSKSIEIRDTWMGPKDINRFIKLWQHGTNPRMEYCRFYLKVRGGEEDKQEIILKRIKYTEVPTDVTRPFRYAGSKDECVTGGIDIWRKDGVKATIMSDFYWGDNFKMFVWFDHCIV